MRQCTFLRRHNIKNTYKKELQNYVIFFIEQSLLPMRRVRMELKMVSFSHYFILYFPAFHGFSAFLSKGRRLWQRTRNGQEYFQRRVNEGVFVKDIIFRNVTSYFLSHLLIKWHHYVFSLYIMKKTDLVSDLCFYCNKKRQVRKKKVEVRIKTGIREKEQWWERRVQEVQKCSGVDRRTNEKGVRRIRLITRKICKKS